MPARSGGSAISSARSTSSSRSRSIVASSRDAKASLGVLGERLAPLLARHGREVGVDALERAEADEQVRRRLVADAGDARDVVRGVALEAEEVGHERRRDAVARHDAVRRVHVHVRHAARREQHADCRETSWKASRSCEITQVGMPASSAAARACRSRRRPRSPRARRCGSRRPRRAAGSTAAAGAAGRASACASPCSPGTSSRCVGRSSQATSTPRGLVVAEQPHEHVREAEERVGREAVGGRELLGERVVGAVAERVAVDQEELAGLARARR